VILIKERCFASMFSLEISRVGRFVSINLLPSFSHIF